ncbi:MAG: phospholipase D family protein [Pseudomonadota bacterium]|nr:phospholipase D family protein [Burkholderiales bacterium]MDQ3196564.1 phospholipase D family protein [Pseudomonadota bacterium]
MPRPLLAALILLNSLLTPLTAGALQPAPDADPRITSAGLIEYAFTPGDAADELIIKAIRNARRQILVQAFSFTHRRIANALIAAKRRGVDVQILADAGQVDKIRTSVIKDLAAAGLPVFLDSAHDSAHDKVMVIDAGGSETCLITGSYNFTHAAQFKNAENVLVIHGRAVLSDAYRDNWKRHRNHARFYRPASDKVR